MLAEPQWARIFGAAKKRGARWPDRSDVEAFKSEVLAALAEQAPPAVSHLSLTRRVAMELIGHESIVLEAYKDSKGIWTWGIGVTDASGHKVGRYKDNPQALDHVLRVYLWLLRERYIPDVVKAFTGFRLTEAQFAAALSFHYNTGAILKADWVAKVKAGDMAGARKAFLNYRRPPEIIPRREKERNLFFDGKWSHPCRPLLLGVRKPSYQPDWKSPKRIDVSADLEKAMAA